MYRICDYLVCCADSRADWRNLFPEAGLVPGGPLPDHDQLVRGAESHRSRCGEREMGEGKRSHSKSALQAVLCQRKQ
jgi:hypothetical protein